MDVLAIRKPNPSLRLKVVRYYILLIMADIILILNTLPVRVLPVKFVGKMTVLFSEFEVARITITFGWEWFLWSRKIAGAITEKCSKHVDSVCS